jgi:hypothetical protein
MKRIFKYRVEPETTTDLTVPIGSTVLSAGLQTYPTNDVVVWVLGEDSDTKTESISILVIGTGQRGDFPDMPITRFIGTVQQAKGGFGFVWHVFEVQR